MLRHKAIERIRAMGKDIARIRGTVECPICGDKITWKVLAYEDNYIRAKHELILHCMEVH